MIEIQILLIAIFTSLACSILGVFLVLRKMSMQIDAISHTVLLGIVLSFMVIPNLNSPLLMIGATLVGILTVFLTELIVKSKKADEESAIGLIFPALFSIAVIIISLKFGNVHLDIDSVLLGKMELSVLDQIRIGEVEIGPKMLYIVLSMFLINLIFVKVFYKELKLVSFDYALASALGFMPTFMHYIFMSLISLTAVTTFNAVGSILVISLMIGPASTALIITKKLKHTILITLLIGVLNSIIGFLISLYIFGGKTTVSGMISTVTLVTFLIVLIFNPKNGLVFNVIKRLKKAN